MKRRLLIIALFLLAGAVVNVAVAWGCAVWSPFREQTALPEEYAAARLGTYAPDLDLIMGGMLRALGLRIEFAHALALQPDGSAEVHVIGWYEAGIPLSCAQGRIRTKPRASEWQYDNLVVPPADLGGLDPLFGRRLLPIGVKWPGFAVNTIFYAALLWLLMYGLSALRRFLRVRRGLCSKCAYPMGESAVCTECGRVLPKRIAT